MALQWADTFNIYGTNTALMLNGLPYAYVDGTVSLVADPDPTAIDNVCKITHQTSTTDQLRTVFPGGAAATMGFAQRLWLSSLPSALGFGTGINVRDAANANQFTVNINTTGTISVVRGAANGTVLGTTTLPVIAPNSWNHIEVKATISTTVGAVEVRVNGASVLSLTGVNNQNTGNTTIAQINHISGSSNAPGATDIFLKDLVIWDTTGSLNNNFMGTVLCIDTLTDGDSSLTWTPNSGSTGYNILAHNPPQDDTSYIAAATTLTSTFTLVNLPANVSSVRGNVLKTRARKIDSGDGNIQHGLKSGASTSLGANHPITTAYTYWYDINETDPATGAAWTPVAFNSAIFQLARTV